MLCADLGKHWVWANMSMAFYVISVILGGVGLDAGVDESVEVNAEWKEWLQILGWLHVLEWMQWI